MAFNNEDRISRLRNFTCPYCGRGLRKLKESDEDHVVGRRFVPKGYLQNSWNLIVRVCTRCNQIKSKLEDDISAISLLASIPNDQYVRDSFVVQEAVRKSSKSISEYTGRPVSESHVKFSLKGKSSFGDVKMDLSGQPQIRDERIFELARMHFAGAFYFLTYDETTKVGSPLSEHYCSVLWMPRFDWGNEKAVAFMKKCQGWNVSLRRVLAREHFKIIVRKKPDVNLWSFATEWNKNIRVCAIYGDLRDTQAFLTELPDLVMHTIVSTSDCLLRYREEMPLNPSEDILFQIGADFLQANSSCTRES